jgi:adenylosuccinate synthase
MTTRQAKVVIGANYGDEGKGLAVDHFAAQTDGTDAVVIRFNGGAQAGHTVTLDDGRRHVFSHFGAGSAAGAATYLSRFFVLQPMVFAKEIGELAALGVRPTLYADPDAQLTTPYDVLINRWVEESRGSARHGSVGLGFGETIERAGGGFALTVRDLGSDVHLVEILNEIRDSWLPRRLANLGVDETPARRAAAADPRVIAGYLAQVEALRRVLFPRPIDAVLNRKNIIFEGAQGLLLDQDRGYAFPYLTRSNTGLKNVLAIAEDAGIDSLEVTYMTRCYLTRHGAGPLRHETAALGFADVVDPTNRPNPWQGSLRLAPLDLDVLHDAIAADLGDAACGRVAIRAGIGVSCLDQLHRGGDIFVGGARLTIPQRDFAWRIAKEVGLPLTLESYGPARAHVRMPPDGDPLQGREQTTAAAARFEVRLASNDAVRLGRETSRADTGRGRCASEKVCCGDLTTLTGTAQREPGECRFAAGMLA